VRAIVCGQCTVAPIHRAVFAAASYCSYCYTPLLLYYSYHHCCCLQGALAKSTLAAVRGAGEAVVRAAVVQPSKSGGGAAAKKLPTVAKGFMQSMTELNTVLEQTTCSFIR
jgi:hypothetical protein